MEPVTHILTGACLARAGFNRRAAYATVAMAIAAELPDVDTLWTLRGPVEGFAHHRGITHTFLGLPFEAALVVAAAYGFHRWRVARAAKVPVMRDRIQRPVTRAPVRWGYLYFCVLLALLSHLLLDYTNNYGVRPFFPLNPHWYAASITFIFDPLMFALLLMALILPQLFGLIGSEVGARKNPFRGRGFAIGALLLIVGLWALRYTEREEAERLAFQQSYDLQQQPAEERDANSGAPTDAAPGIDAAPATPPSSHETDLFQPPPKILRVQRLLTSPDPFNPFHWAVAMDFGPLYQLATVDTLAGDVTPTDITYSKRDNDAALQTAEASQLGRVYLDWSPMPILTEDLPTTTGSRSLRQVTFRDPRFMGDVQWLHTSDAAPLTGVVTVDDSGQIVRQSLDGRPEPAGRVPAPETHLDFDLNALWDRLKSTTPKPVPLQPALSKTASVKPLPPPVAQPPAPPVDTIVPRAPATHAPAKQKQATIAVTPPPPALVKQATPAKPEPGLTSRFQNWIHWLTGTK